MRLREKSIGYVGRVMTTDLYHKIIKAWKDVGIDITDGWDRYKNSIPYKAIPHRTIRSKENARRLLAFILKPRL